MDSFLLQCCVKMQDPTAYRTVVKDTQSKEIGKRGKDNKVRGDKR